MKEMLTEVAHNIKGIWVGVTEYLSIKFIPAILSPLGVFLFGVDHVVVMKALIVLVVIDFVTGIWSAKESREKITSRRAVKSAYKLVIYGMLVSGSHLAETVIPGQTFLEEIVTSFLAITELISIIENTGKLGYAIPKKLLNRLQQFRDSQ